MAKLWLVLAALTLLSFIASAHLIFVVAPVEMQMGVVQKIFYFHVPSAYAMYLAFLVSAISSAMYLAKRSDRWDALGVSAAEVGVLFCAMVLLTGPLWARKAWGVWWTWDPRLTSTLAIGMVFGSYLALRSFLGDAGEAEKRFSAALAVVGVMLIPVIHYSVTRWRGQHPTVITKQGGGLDPGMVPGLVASFVLFTLLAATLIWIRAALERAHQQTIAIELEAAQQGLLRDL